MVQSDVPFKTWSTVVLPRAVVDVAKCVTAPTVDYFSCALSFVPIDGGVSVVNSTFTTRLAVLDHYFHPALSTVPMASLSA